jgi:hypothetical protein
MESLIECPICSELYDSNLHLPLVLLCGHTLCKACTLKLKMKNNLECPFDRKPETREFSQISHSYHILQLIEYMVKTDKQFTKLSQLNFEYESEITSQKLVISKSQSDIDRLNYLLSISKRRRRSSKQRRQLEHANIIYRTIDKTKKLYNYDIMTGEEEVAALDDFVERDFKYSSVCVMPNGDAFIAGGKYKLSNLCYIYRRELKDCVKVPSLLHARGSISLYYHDDCIYAFGGSTGLNNPSKQAEKFELSTGVWIELAEMLECRENFNCIGYEDRIYLISGCGGQTVEEYNTLTDSYNLVVVNLHDRCNVLGIADDAIYLILDKDLIVMNSEFQVMDQITDCWNGGWEWSNVVIYENSVFLYNPKDSSIDTFDLSSFNYETVNKINIT